MQDIPDDIRWANLNTNVVGLLSHKLKINARIYLNDRWIWNRIPRVCFFHFWQSIYFDGKDSFIYTQKSSLVSTIGIQVTWSFAFGFNSSGYLRSPPEMCWDVWELILCRSSPRNKQGKYMCWLSATTIKVNRIGYIISDIIINALMKKAIHEYNMDWDSFIMIHARRARKESKTKCLKCNRSRKRHYRPAKIMLKYAI